MKMTSYLLILSSLCTSICRAEEIPLSDPNPTCTSRVFSFATDKHQKTHRDIGKLTLSEEKKNVKLEFEATGLKKGLYKIVIADHCKIGKGKKRFSYTTELYTFNTQYGEVSSEDTLTFSKIADLPLDGKSVVLLKIGKQQDQIASCVK